jgi:hypothetical protein
LFELSRAILRGFHILYRMLSRIAVHAIALALTAR